MEPTPRLGVKFWGVRGSTPTPVYGNLGFGGNTTCLEVQVPTGDVIIIDAGTGVRQLGLSLVERFQSKCLSAHFFLTHFHWDHIQGLPFFAPLYSPKSEVTFHSGRSEAGVKLMLENQMASPFFPVSFELLAAQRNFSRVERTAVKCGDVTVYGFPMNHPQRATGYRLEREGAVIVHASDLEHGDPTLDGVLREYAEGADVLIYDAQYTPEEYESKRGWGHSTWLEATRVARDANVKKLILCHHDPAHDDARLKSICDQARREFDNTEIAAEGSNISL